MTDDGVSRRAVRSGGLALLEEVFQRLTWIVRGLVIARLVSPAELGRFALVLALTSAFEVMTSPGLVDALIQTGRADQKVQRTVWSVMVVRGLGLSIVVAVGAPLLAALVGHQDLVPLLRLMGVALFVQSCVSLGPALAQRRIEYRQVATLQVFSTAATTALMIVFAATTRRADGLIFASVLGATLTTGASYLVGGFRPAFAIDLRRLRELFRFARWRFASNLAWYVSTSADDIALGRWVSTNAVGYYRVAFQVGYLPSTSVANALAKVAFPTFSEVRRERPPTALADGYLRYVRLVVGIAAMLGAAVAALATPFIEALLGPRWLPAVPPLVVLSAAGVVRALAATGGALFLGAGRPGLDARMQWVRAGVLLPALALVLPYGVLGAAAASLISVLGALLAWGLGLRALDMDRVTIVMEALRRLPVPAIALAVTVLVSRSIIAGPWHALLGGSLTFVTVWSLLIWVGDRSLFKELALIRRMLRARRH